MAKIWNCTKCGPLPISQFYKHATRGYQTQCKICRAEYNKGHYRRNSRIYKTRAALRNRDQKAKLHKKLLEYLREHPCTACGETDPVVLDFHHRDRRTKKFSIGRILGYGLSWEAILREIGKCEVLCANDHRRQHAKERNTYRYRGRSG